MGPLSGRLWRGDIFRFRTDVRFRYGFIGMVFACVSFIILSCSVVRAYEKKYVFWKKGVEML